MDTFATLYVSGSDLHAAQWVWDDADMIDVVDDVTCENPF